MASKRLDRMKLDAKYVNLLEKANIYTCGELLQANLYQLMGQSGLGFNELNELCKFVSSRIMPQSITASELWQNERKSDSMSMISKTNPLYYRISTHIPSLDALLRGGIVVGGITEVVGLPGIGKSQLCLNVCAEVLLQPSIDDVLVADNPAILSTLRSVMYVDTELKFSPARLAEILVNRMMLSSDRMMLSTDRMMNDTIDQATRVNSLYTFVNTNVMNRVKVVRPTTSAELSSFVADLESMVVEDKISLIIIDSMAAIARKEGLDETDKEQNLVRLAASLTTLAEVCRCGVLVTNQIAPSSTTSLHSQIVPPEFNAYQPALGPVWGHCVHTRLCMFSPLHQSSRLVGTGEDEIGLPASVRCIEVTKHPAVQTGRVMCKIEGSGLTAFSESGR